jgi:hypothetical protein
MSLVVESMKTAHRAVATTPTFGLTSLRFQHDVTAATLTVNAHQRVVTVFTTQTVSRGHTAFFTAGSFYDWVS